MLVDWDLTSNFSALGADGVTPGSDALLLWDENVGPIGCNDHALCVPTGVLSIDITTLAQKWVNGAVPNYGLALLPFADGTIPLVIKGIWSDTPPKLIFTTGELATTTITTTTPMSTTTTTTTIPTTQTCVFPSAGAGVGGLNVKGAFVSYLGFEFIELSWNESVAVPRQEEITENVCETFNQDTGNNTRSWKVCRNVTRILVANFTFAKWELDIRSHGFNTWSPVSLESLQAVGRSLQVRSPLKLRIRFLTKGNRYTFRLREVGVLELSDPPASNYVYWPWVATLPGYWDTDVPISLNSRTANVNVGLDAYRCWPVDVDSGNVFSYCPAANSPTVVVSRQDFPKGWAVAPKLRCMYESQGACNGHKDIPAAAPLLTASVPAARSFFVQWRFNALNSCRCAKPQLEVTPVKFGVADVWAVIGGDCADVSKRQCTVSGLEPDVRHKARLKVVCDNDVNSPVNSEYAAADKVMLTLPACSEVPVNPFLPAALQPPPCVPRVRTPAGAPSGFAMADMGSYWFLLSWEAGSVGECVFAYWVVEWRSNNGDWQTEADCSGVKARDATSSCNVTILEDHSNTDIHFRVAETCINIKANGGYGYSQQFRWYKEESYDMRVGSSTATTVEMKTMITPSYCTVQGLGNDEFSMCYGGSAYPSSAVSSVKVTRTDEQSGWGGEMWVRCFANDRVAPVEVRPAAPKSFHVSADENPDKSMYGIFARYVLGMGIGTCRCAQTWLEFRPVTNTRPTFPLSDVVNWTRTVTGGCADMPSKQCLPTDLQPDTQYDARVRVYCANNQTGDLSSSYVGGTHLLTGASTAEVTYPGCHWSYHSGRSSEFLCADGWFCHMSVTDCCQHRGSSRARCPRSLPIMCATATACAGGKDYCCVVDEASCTAPINYGGRRSCTAQQVPAYTPQFTIISSNSPASLTINWTTSSYLRGDVSPCVFTRWSVELAKQLDDRKIYRGYKGFFKHPSLGPTALALEITLTTVSEGTWSSYLFSGNIGNVAFTRSGTSIQIQDPSGLGIRLDGTETREGGTIMGDCFFSGVRGGEFSLTPLDGYLGVSDYVLATNCINKPQTTRQCTQGGLQGHGRYYVRIREECTVASLRSLTTAVTFSTKTNPIGAMPPPYVNCSIYTGYDNDNGTITVSSDPLGYEAPTRTYKHQGEWAPGVQNNCSFVAYELQLRYLWRDVPDDIYDPVAAGSDWIDACFVVGNRNFTTCAYNVRPNRPYRLRVRERCNDTLASSDWRESGEEVCTSNPLRASAPANFSVFDTKAATFQSSWDAGDTDFDSCVFQAWDVQAKAVGIEWPGQYVNFSHSMDVAVGEDAANRTVWKKVYWLTEEWTELKHAPYTYYGFLPTEDTSSVAIDSNTSINVTVDVNKTWNETRRFDDYINATDIVYGCSIRNRSHTSCLIRVANVGGLRYDVRLREVCTDSALNSEWVYIDTPFRPITPIPEVVLVRPVLSSFLPFRTPEERVVFEKRKTRTFNLGIW